MASRTNFRFSLFSLLLLITLTGVGVSHWLTSRRLAGVQAELAELQRTVKNSNDDAGTLTIENPARIHVIAIDHITAQQRHGDLALRIGWKLYVPPGSSWRLCGRIGQVPIHGLPTEPTWRLALDTGSDSECYITLVFSKDSANRWTAHLLNGRSKASYPIPTLESMWLDKRLPLGWEGAGDHKNSSTQQLAETESFPADAPVILLRCRPAWSGVQEVVNEPRGSPVVGGGWISPSPWPPDNSPVADGVMVWLEPIVAD
jgi:hypothetical protein